MIRYFPLLFLLSLPKCCLAQSLTLDEAVSHALTVSAVAERAALVDRSDSLAFVSNVNSYRPSVALSLSAPSVSNSYSQVTQPDGSLSYKKVFISRGSASLSINVPIIPTGGSTSLSSSINVYRNQGTGTGGLSVNYVQFSLSQPLDFFPEMKWQRAVTVVERQASLKESDLRYIKVRSQVVSAYFDILTLRLQQRQAGCQLSLAKMRIEVDSAALLANRISPVEVEQDFVSFLEAEADLQSINSSLISRIAEANDALGLELFTLAAELELPAIPLLSMSDDDIMDAVLELVRTQNKPDMLSAVMNEVKVRRQRFFSSSISANVGLSSSGSDFQSLRDANMVDAGASVSFSVTLTGFGDGKRKLEMALISKVAQEKSSHSEEASAVTKAQYLLTSFRQNVSISEILARKRAVLSANLSRVENLLLNGRAKPYDLCNVQAQLAQCDYDYAKAIANAYTNISSLQVLTASLLL